MTEIQRKHFLAICRSLTDGKYYSTNMLYPDEERAHKELGASFHCLWIEGPTIMLGVFETPKRKAKVENIDLVNQKTMFDDFDSSLQTDKSSE
jgi:hypothetical protein